jgi:hypothetical protein
LNIIDRLALNCGMCPPGLFLEWVRGSGNYSRPPDGHPRAAIISSTNLPKAS